MQSPNARLDFRWDDLRVLLALFRAGSLSAAARRLGINTSTVGRRLTALEEALGVDLFERSPDGVTPTDAAEELFSIAEEMERSAADVTRAIEGMESEPEGLVRISAPPGVTTHFLAPTVCDLRRRYPRLRIELDASIGYADLTRREADLALRGRRPKAGDLVMTKLGESRLAIFAAPALIKNLEPLSDPCELPWISWADNLAHLDDATWLSARVPNDNIVLRTSSIDAQIAAARAGVGALLLPHSFVHFAGLRAAVLSTALESELARVPLQPLWLVGHRALRRVPRVAAVWDFLVEQAALLSLR